MMLAFGWKFQQAGGSGKLIDPLTRITIQHVKKVNVMIQPGKRIQKQCKEVQSYNDVRETFGLFTLLRF